MKHNFAKIALWLFMGVLISNLIYNYGFELLEVPTSSMEGTIRSGQYVLVNKLIPGPRFFVNNPNKYSRPFKFKELAYDDIIVFNFPDADTTITNKPGESYYLLKRQYPNLDSLLVSENWGKLEPTKVKHRPRMVKRITGMPGDTIEIKKGILYVNSQVKKEINVCFSYIWTGNNRDLKKALKLLNDKIKPIEKDKKTYLYLNSSELEQLGRLSINCKKEILSQGISDNYIFPYKKEWLWNADNMGPIYLPSKGETIDLTMENIPIYRRMIEVFEHTPIEIKEEIIYSNNTPINSYTFKLNYYWVHGDNRPRSFDSRYWGPVPENHIVGVVKYRD